MAHSEEPMDIDHIESDFDNKENNFHHNNVYPRTPCTEKGYEELDVSELNMKLRYSCTPASSPMSKSYTANCVDNNNHESGDDTFNANLTRSFNSAISKNDILSKTVKTLPLQELTTELLIDNRNASVLRPLDTTVMTDTKNIMVTVTGTSDLDENISFPSSSSSAVQTPEAATPTKDVHRNDGSSPIMRGLKSVLNMFRSSQSPIPPMDGEVTSPQQVLSPAEMSLNDTSSKIAPTVVLASTPIASHKIRECSVSKRSSPHKESIVFNEDLEKELLWKDETTILFSEEKIPIHKLFPTARVNKMNENQEPKVDNFDSTVEYMDISYNDSIIKNNTLTENSGGPLNIESDNEFVDCEITLTDKLSDSKIDVSFENEDKKEMNVTNIIKNTNLQPSVDIPLVGDEKKFTVEEPVLFDTTQILKINELMTDSSIAKSNPDDNQISINKCDVKREESIVIEEPKDDKLHMQISASQNITEFEVSITNEKTKDIVNMNEITTQIVDAELICNSTIVSVAEPDLIVNQVSFNITDIQPEANETGDITGCIQDSSEMQIKLPELPFDQSVGQDNEKYSKTESATCTDPCRMDNVSVLKENDIQQLKDTVNISPESSSNNQNLQSTITSQCGNINESVDGIAPASTNDVNLQKEASNVLVSPANIPLPDEDDIEGDKSLGPCIIEKYATVTFNINKDINNMSISTNLESLNNIEQMPIEAMDPAKLLNENKVMNDTFNKDNSNLTEGQNNTNIKQIIKDESILEANNVSAEITAENSPIKEVEQIEFDLNKTNTDIQVLTDTQIIPKIDSHMCLQKDANTTELDYKEDINPKLDVEMKDELIEPQPLKSENHHNIIAETIGNTFESVDSQDQHMSVETTIQKLDYMREYEIVTNKSVQETIEINKNEGVQASQLPKEIIKNDKNAKHEQELCVKSNNETTTLPTNALPEFSLDDTNVNTNLVESYSSKNEVGTVTTLVATTKAAINLTPSSITEHALETSTKNLNITEMCIQALYTPMIESESNSEEISNDQQILNKDEVEENIDEEVIISENNSPYVSVASDIDTATQPINFGEIDNPFVTKTNIAASPPLSSKIISKGYNFNFDEIDDPFATKTKIRISPTPESPKETSTQKVQEKSTNKDLNKNRRKSQLERKKIVPKKRLNSTFSGSTKANEEKSAVLKSTKKPMSINLETDGNNRTGNLEKSQDILISESKLEGVTTYEATNVNITYDSSVMDPQTNGVENRTCETIEETLNLPPETKNAEVDKSDKNIEIKLSAESVISSTEGKTTSSSEQSTYFSAVTSSTESVKTRNVFNIPEIDDANFNRFVTKTVMRQSPPRSLEDTYDKKSDLSVSKINASLEENEHANVSNTTSSSKADEKDITVREVNTEDEDTIEGPFLEAEDLNEDKMSDFDGDDVDMMQFSELPTQTNDDAGELFIDAEAFEFLLNQNKTNEVSNSGKESLFLKFDPLFAKRVSTDGVLTALSNVQKRQSTPKKITTAQQINITFEKAMAGPSTATLNETREVDSNIAEESGEDMNITVAKPMMVVTPAVNPVVTPRNKPSTPTSSNRRSLTFTSPAIAVIDRLLSLSGNNSMLGHDTTITQASREQNEADLALTQLRELLAEKEINVYNLRTESKELKDRLSNMESQMRQLEAEGEERLKKVNELNEKLTEKTKLNKSMAAVVEEYERTIASLIAETEQEKKRNNEERIKLIKERDEQTAHLASMEVSFSDLHSKYEKSKQIILTCKANEDSYKKSIKEFEENLTKMQSNYELLKQHATSKLNHANQELEKMNRTHEAEVLKLNAMIKRKELHITSLEETLAQKTKANEELTAICDELINKVG